MDKQVRAIADIINDMVSPPPPKKIVSEGLKNRAISYYSFAKYIERLVYNLFKKIQNKESSTTALWGAIGKLEKALNGALEKEGVLDYTDYSYRFWDFGEDLENEEHRNKIFAGIRKNSYITPFCGYKNKKVLGFSHRMKVPGANGDFIHFAHIKEDLLIVADFSDFFESYYSESDVKGFVKIRNNAEKRITGVKGIFGKSIKIATRGIYNKNASNIIKGCIEKVETEFGKFIIKELESNGFKNIYGEDNNTSIRYEFPNSTD